MVSTDGLGDKADPLIFCFSEVFKPFCNKHFPTGKSLLDSCKHYSQLAQVMAVDDGFVVGVVFHVFG